MRILLTYVRKHVRQADNCSPFVFGFVTKHPAISDEAFEEVDFEVVDSSLTRSAARHSSEQIAFQKCSSVFQTIAFWLKPQQLTAQQRKGGAKTRCIGARGKVSFVARDCAAFPPGSFCSFQDFGKRRNPRGRNSRNEGVVSKRLNLLNV